MLIINDYEIRKLLTYYLRTIHLVAEKTPAYQQARLYTSIQVVEYLLKRPEVRHALRIKTDSDLEKILTELSIIKYQKHT